MKKAQKNCPFCHQKLKLSRQSFYSNSDNEMELASGGWTCLYIGLDPNGRTVMRACGDDYTNNYYPKFCPECGRDLQEPASN